MTEGEMAGAPKSEELVGEVQEAPVDAAVVEAEAAKVEAETRFAAALQAQADRDAKVAAFIAKVQDKAKGTKGTKTNGELMQGHFTEIMKILDGRRCPTVVIVLLARCGDWVDSNPLYAKNNFQNAIDHAKRADYYNRLDAKEYDKVVKLAGLVESQHLFGFRLSLAYEIAADIAAKANATSCPGWTSVEA